MNIEIANRLIALRKKSGLSQEELADKLGLSRQAVSKWERAEASPDTDNLICLAKIYGVTLDELLKTDEDIESIAEEQREKTKEDGLHISTKEGDEIHVSDGEVHIKDKDGDEIHIEGGKLHLKDADSDIILGGLKPTNIIEKSVIASLLGLITILYVVFGCLFDGVWPYPLVWPIGWVAFLLVPLATCVFEGIKKKTFASFTGVVVFLGLIVFFILGFVLNAWHPGWTVFLSIPLYGCVAEMIDKLLKKKDDTPSL